MALKLLLLVSLTISLGSPEELPPAKRLIKYKVTEPATWMTPAEIEDHFLTHRFGYLDLTREGVDVDPTLTTRKGRRLPDYSYPDHPLQTEVLHQLFPQLEKHRLEGSVKKLSSYPNRHSRRSFGKTSAEGWLRSQITSLLADYDGISSILSVKDPYLDDPIPDYVPYLQRNWIVKLVGQDPKLQSELVILGAHYDTLWGVGDGNPRHPKANATLPGADDNASCVAVLLEVLRLLIQNGATLKHSVEFHFYTAKETGLHGAEDVVNIYQNASATVRGMLNLDTCGFGQTIGYAEQTLWSGERETSEPLTRFVKMLADNYVGKEFKVKQFECDPNCWGDHYIWTKGDFHSAYFFEYELIPRDRWHSEKDTVEHVNFELVNEFAKLALAFVIELGELESICICGGGKLEGGWAKVGISLVLVIWILHSFTFSLSAY